MPSRRCARLPAMLVFALALVACAPKEKPEDVPSPDTIACQLDGTRIVIRFLADELRMLTPDGERVVLQKVPSSSGVRYTNGLMEVRSVGSPMAQQGLVFIRDGNASNLTGCAPVMVPGAPK